MYNSYTAHARESLDEVQVRAARRTEHSPRVCAQRTCTARCLLMPHGVPGGSPSGSCSLHWRTESPPERKVSLVRDPTTWTVNRHDGPNHLGLCALHHMALITSDCAPFTTWP